MSCWFWKLDTVQAHLCNTVCLHLCWSAWGHVCNGRLTARPQRSRGEGGAQMWSACLMMKLLLVKPPHPHESNCILLAHRVGKPYCSICVTTNYTKGEARNTRWFKVAKMGNKLRGLAISASCLALHHLQPTLRVAWGVTMLEWTKRVKLNTPCCSLILSHTFGYQLINLT